MPDIKKLCEDIIEGEANEHLTPTVGLLYRGNRPDKGKTRIRCQHHWVEKYSNFRCSWYMECAKCGKCVTRLRLPKVMR
jgi:hypothetical protein